MEKKYYMQIMVVNGEVKERLSSKPFCIEHICRGGFRFITNEKFDLEDRVKVKLLFPDDHSQVVLGRICYSDMIDHDRTAYGFSVIDGFYSLQANGV